MHSIELALGMLLAVLASGYLVRALPVAVPLPLVQIALGGLIAGVFHHGVTLQPEVFFLLFLPPLLFLDGWRIPKDGLLRDRGMVLQLALGLVVFTVIGAGYFIHWLIPAMPLALAFALAAVISPTDPVAVSAVTARVPVPRRLMHILEGESLLNDASGLVCFQFAVATVLTGSFALQSAALAFSWVATTGLICGAAFTIVVAYLQQALTRRFGAEGGTSILVNLLTPFGAYLLAEQLEASGILAAVAAGVTMSYVELSGRAMATTRIERAAVWNTIQFTLNGVMFVLLGEQLPNILDNAIAAVQQSGHREVWWLAVYAVSITGVLIALRFAWVWVSFRLGRRKGAGQPSWVGHAHWKLVLATALAGVRGAITLAGVLTLPLLLPGGAPFPARDLAIFLAASVILLSLLIASLGLPPLLRNLHLAADTLPQEAEDMARSSAANAAMAMVRKAQQEIEAEAHTLDAQVCADAANRVIAAYQQRLYATDLQENTDAERLRHADVVERRLRLAALRAEREEILRLARRRQISDATSRRLVQQIDLMEELYR
ncbi:MAG: Na+/H+ antiporter [Ottowia sp.]|nr:Na+/H+ antiporter [Ottowia sp.]